MPLLRITSSGFILSFPYLFTFVTKTLNPQHLFDPLKSSVRAVICDTENETLTKGGEKCTDIEREIVLSNFVTLLRFCYRKEDFNTGRILADYVFRCIWEHAGVIFNMLAIARNMIRFREPFKDSEIHLRVLDLADGSTPVTTISEEISTTLFYADEEFEKIWPQYNGAPKDPMHVQKPFSPELSAQILRATHAYIYGAYSEKTKVIYVLWTRFRDLIATNPEYTLFSGSSQGAAFNRTAIVNSINMFGIDPIIELKMQWLKLWILDVATTQKAVEGFVFAVTSKKSMTTFDKIYINPSTAFQAHTCSNTLDVPNNDNTQSAFINSIGLLLSDDSISAR